MITNENNKKASENISKGSSIYLVNEQGQLCHYNLPYVDIKGICPIDEDIAENLPYELTLTFFVQRYE